MTLSVLHRRHGLDPSHLVFFMRQRSQALRTLFRMPSEVSCTEVAFGEMERWLDADEMGDIVAWCGERKEYRNQSARTVASSRLFWVGDNALGTDG